MRSVIAMVAFAAFVLGASTRALSADAPAKVDAKANAKTDAKASKPTKKAAGASVPADRIVVMYFHRTQRCPTCRKMGGYSEEAVTTGFAQEIKDGKVEFHSIDFQDKKNEALTKGYQVSGPTLIVAKVVKNKVADRKNLTDMWSKAGDKDAFIEYVQSNVKDYQKK